MYHTDQISKAKVQIVVVGVVVGVIISLAFWMYCKRRKRILHENYSDERRNSKGSRRPSIYVLPMSKPQIWDQYRTENSGSRRNSYTQTKPPGKVVPVEFIVVGDQIFPPGLIHNKYYEAEKLPQPERF